jgi:cytochrome P450
MGFLVHLACFVLGTTVCFLGVVIYNLIFHPLANTSGPFLARASSLPSFYHACKGDRHVWIWQNFQIYGDTFRAAPNLVLFNNPHAHTDIYGFRANITRSSFYRAWRRHKDDVHVLNSTNPELHSRKRKLLQLAFTEQSLKAASPLMVEHIKRWIELLCGNLDADGWSDPRNMADWVDCLTFDIMGDLCFGERFDTKEPGENSLKKIPHLTLQTASLGYKVWSTFLKVNLRLILTLGQISKSPLFSLMLYLQPRGLSKLMERVRKIEVKDYNDFVETSVNKRVAAHVAGKVGAVREDIFHFLLKAIDPDTKQPAYTNHQHLISEARVLTLAGSDTTSTTLCALFFYLTHNSRVITKVTAEVRSSFKSANEIVLGTRLSRCRYLRACIDEALRLSPPSPGELPREVLPGGAVINGTAYPAGTEVGCSPWSMGRNESVYGDVNTYRPERWIPSSDPTNLRSDSDILELKKAFHPFSIGPMNCAGQNIAVLELMLISARAVWATDFRLAPGYRNGEGSPDMGWGQRSHRQYVVKDSWLCIKDGPVLQFRPRTD